MLLIILAAERTVADYQQAILTVVIVGLIALWMYNAVWVLLDRQKKMCDNCPQCKVKSRDNKPD
jgi:hypothetical protein